MDGSVSLEYVSTGKQVDILKALTGEVFLLPPEDVHVGAVVREAILLLFFPLCFCLECTGACVLVTERLSCCSGNSFLFWG